MHWPNQYEFNPAFQEHPTSPSAQMSDITDNPETPRSAGRNRGAARRGGGMDPVTSSPGRDLPAFEDESHLLDGDEVPGKTRSCMDLL